MRVKLKTKYKQGIIQAYHKYKIGSSVRIKVLAINGRKVMVKSYFHQEGFGGKIRNAFVNVGDDTWHWVYYQSGATKNKEIVKNWSPSE